MIQESAYPQIHCNQKGHTGELISHVCLKADCKEQRAHCRKCNLTQHRQCFGEIQFMDEITLQIKSIDLTNIKIIHIIEQAIKKFQNVLKEYNSIKQFIQQYSEVPNLANLNIVAGILNYYSQQNIEKLLQGQEILDDLIKSHFMPQFTQIIYNQESNTNSSQEIVTNTTINHITNSEITNSIQTNITPQINDIDNTSCKSSIDLNSQININNENSNNNNSNNSNNNNNNNDNNNSNNNKNTNNNNNNNNNDNNDNNNNNNNSNNKDNDNSNNKNTNTNNNNNNNNNNNHNKNNLTQIDKVSADFYHKKGQFHYNNKQYEQALENFGLAVILNPNCPSSWNNKGTSLNRLERDVESIECFDKALEIVNSKPQIDRESKISYLRNKASTLYRLEQYQESVNTIDEGLKLDPKNKTFFSIKGMILNNEFNYLSLIHTNQLTEALKFVDEVIELDSSKYIPYKFKGVILHKLKRLDEAIENLCMANSIKPKTDSYIYLGKLLEEQCQFDEAESCYKSALELDKNDSVAQLQLLMVQQYKQFL